MRRETEIVSSSNMPISGPKTDLGLIRMGKEDAAGKVIYPYVEESLRQSCSEEFDKGTAREK